MAKTKGKKQQGKAVKNKSAGAGKRTTQTKEKTDEGKGKGAQTAPAVRKSCTAKGSCQTSSSPASTRQRSQTSRSKPVANAQSKQPTAKTKTKERNVRKVQIGGTIKTKDKYLPYDPQNVQELKERRWVVVIDKNTNEELAIVRLTDEKQSNTTELPTYKKGNKRKTYFKHFVEIEDNEGNAIRIDGEKFIKNAEKYNVSKEELNIIQSVVRAHCKQAQSNKDNLKKLKDKK